MRVEPLEVVLDDLLRPRGGVLDRQAVPGERDARRERRDAAERSEVVAERIRPGAG